MDTGAQRWSYELSCGADATRDRRTAAQSAGRCRRPAAKWSHWIPSWASGLGQRVAIPQGRSSWRVVDITVVCHPVARSTSPAIRACPHWNWKVVVSYGSAMRPAIGAARHGSVYLALPTALSRIDSAPRLLCGATVARAAAAPQYFPAMLWWVTPVSAPAEPGRWSLVARERIDALRPRSSGSRGRRLYARQMTASWWR